MSRQLDQIQEQRTARRHLEIVKAVEYALQGAVERSGGEYHGFAYKHHEGDGLLIIKALFPSGQQVAFCGASDLGSCLTKATRLGNQDNLPWRADKYARSG